MRSPAVWRRTEWDRGDNEPRRAAPPTFSRVRADRQVYGWSKHTEHRMSYVRFTRSPVPRPCHRHSHSGKRWGRFPRRRETAGSMCSVRTSLVRTVEVPGRAPATLRRSIQSARVREAGLEVVAPILGHGRSSAPGRVHAASQGRRREVPHALDLGSVLLVGGRSAYRSG